MSRRPCAFCGESQDDHAPACAYWTFFGPNDEPPPAPDPIDEIMNSDLGDIYVKVAFADIVGSLPDFPDWPS